MKKLILLHGPRTFSELRPVVKTKVHPSEYLALAAMLALVIALTVVAVVRT